MRLLFTATISGINKSSHNNPLIPPKTFFKNVFKSIQFCIIHHILSLYISLLKSKTRTKMERYSNNTTTELPFIHCPPLPDLIQWRRDYLTPAAFYNSVATVIVNALFSFVSAISNSLLIIAILANRDLRRNHFMIIVLSLSITGKIWLNSRMFQFVDKY